MKIKWLIAICIIIVIEGLIISNMSVGLTYDLDMLEVNRLTQYIETNWDESSGIQLPYSPLSPTFVPHGVALHFHIRARDTIVPVYSNEQHVGFLVFYSQITETLEQAQQRITTLLFAQALRIGMYIIGFA